MCSHLKASSSKTLFINHLALLASVLAAPVAHLSQLVQGAKLQKKNDERMHRHLQIVMTIFLE